MTLKLLFTSLLGITCILKFAYPQCSTPSVSIAGTYCIGNQLTLNSNVIPVSVTWSLAGNVVAKQTATFNTQATTVAGGNGLGNNANQLNYPDRLYVDGDGAIYIPDMENDRVQKWLPGATNGITVAGGNGKGNAANQLNRPTGVFVDNQGNLYVADQMNNRVQKWEPGVTQGITVAGDGGYTTLLYPTDVFVDGSGYIYVSDQGNGVIRKFSPGSIYGGVVIAGKEYNSGSGPNQLYSPTGFCIDAGGNIYICDTDNMRVQKWTPGATSGVTIGSGYNPIDICVDCNGNVYVADYTNHGIRKYDSGGNETLFAGGNGPGSGANQFYNPAGVAMLGNNEIYVADFRNHRVQKYSSSINPVFTPTTRGTYTVTANYSCCPSFTKTFELNNGLAEVSITATNTSICLGDVVTFTSQNVNQVTNPVYRWKLNGTDVGTNSSEFKISTLQGNDIVFCELTGVDVCGTNATGTSNSVQIKIHEALLPDLGPDLVLCPGADTLLKTIHTYNNYLWQDNSTLSALPINGPGKYYLTVQDQCNRVFSDTIFVSLFKTDNKILPADTTICYYENPVLKPLKKLRSYLWSNQISDDYITIAQPGLYWLQAKDDQGCTVRDSIYFYSKNCPARGIYMPNAFTPDNNGRNDLLRPVIYGTVRKYRFSVFNRYGQMVFNTTDPQKGWNGTINNNYPNAGTYVWYCTFELEGQKPVTEKGTVVLIK